MKLWPFINETDLRAPKNLFETHPNVSPLSTDMLRQTRGVVSRYVLFLKLWCATPWAIAAAVVTVLLQHKAVSGAL